MISRHWTENMLDRQVWDNSEWNTNLQLTVCGIPGVPLLVTRCPMGINACGYDTLIQGQFTQQHQPCFKLNWDPRFQMKAGLFLRYCMCRAFRYQIWPEFEQGKLWFILCNLMMAYFYGKDEERVIDNSLLVQNMLPDVIGLYILYRTPTVSGSVWALTKKS